MELALIARRRKAEIALESDDVILKLKYLLEKLAEKLPGGLGAEVLEATFKLLETLVVRYPRTVNRYVEHVALNFDIWGHSASELQYFVIDLMNKMIFDPERHQLSKEDVVDHLLNCIEKLAAARAPDRRNIETLSQMVRKILAESSLSKLMSYLNIPHLQQRHPNYEAPLSAFLHIFFEIFRSRTRGPPLIFSLLTVLLHFLATPAPAESKSWLSEGRLELRHLSVDFGPDLHSKQSSNAATTVILGGSERLVEGESVDAVLAGYIFAAITFDWKRIKGTAKALAKEPEKVKQLESITKDLAGQSDKAKIRCKGRRLGPATYTAIMSAALGLQPLPCESSAERAQILDQLVGHSVFKSPKLYVELISNFSVLTPSARLCFLSDHYILSKSEALFAELARAGALFCFASCILQQPEPLNEEVAETYSRLLMFVLQQSKQVDDVCPFFGLLLPAPAFAVPILQQFLGDLCNKTERLAGETSCGVFFALISAVHLLEDLQVLNQSLLASPHTMIIMARLLLALGKTDAIYFSYPGISASELQSVTTETAAHLLALEPASAPSLWGRPNIARFVPREGGCVRFLLNTILLLCKHDSRKECYSVAAMEFFLLRDRDSKAKLRLCADVTAKKQKHSGSRKKKEKYCFLDLLFGYDKAKISAHTELMRGLSKKLPPPNESVLSPHGSAFKSAAAEPSLFELGGFQMLYLVSELIHLLQFELLGIASYTMFPDEESVGKLLVSVADANSHFPFSPKLRALADLLCVMLITMLDQKTAHHFEAQVQQLVSRAGNGTRLLADIRSPIYEYTAKEIPAEPQDASMIKNDAASCFDLFTTLPEKLKKAKSADEKCVCIILTTMCSGYMRIQPSLTFLTADNFRVLDMVIKMKAKRTEEKYKGVMFVVAREECGKFAADLSAFLEEEAGGLTIHREKLGIILCHEKVERDLVSKTWRLMLASELTSMQKSEEQSELGTIYNHDRIMSRTSSEFLYVNSRYQKILARCPLHSALRAAGRLMPNPFDVFIKLDLRRDALGRAHRIKWADLRHPGYRVSILASMRYLRHAYIKKLMVLSLSNRRITYEETKRVLGKDLKHDVMRVLFTGDNGDKPKESCGAEEAISGRSLLSLGKKEKEDHEKESAESNKSEDIDFNEDTQKNGPRNSIRSTGSERVRSRSEEKPLAPNAVPCFEVEMITIRHAVFGRLALCRDWLVFWSEPRRVDPKFRFSSQELAHSTKRVCKRWRMSAVREAVVKRFNLIRQSVEIYFDDYTSVFFNFFSHDREARFTMCFAKLFKDDPHVRIVPKPEVYFLESKFPERWVHGEFTNFEYLALLNKYGGRTFNDLGQYPVFPWVLTDYTSASLYSPDKIGSTYRDFNYPIAAITRRKREDADEKLNALVREEGFQHFQFGSHYLPARAVLGYTFRLEPFTSLLIKYEEGQDSASRMFHCIEKTWENVSSDISDNRELIPEFFYSPWIFPNYNAYFFGAKPAESKILWNVDRREERTKVVVDQVILPRWASDHHYFIEQNVTALESKYASTGLHEWIDMVFGIKQQDPKIYNLFRELSEESVVRKRRKTLTAENLAEIQEFGTVPIQLFRQLHTRRDPSLVPVLAAFSSEKKSFVLQRLAALPEPVVAIFPSVPRAGKSMCTLVVSNQGSIFELKEKDSEGRIVLLDFPARMGTAQPRRAPFNKSAKQFLYDGQRNVVPAAPDDGKLVLLYSGYYDHAFRSLLQVSSREFVASENPRVEESPVTCVACDSSHPGSVFVGCANGTTQKYRSSQAGHQLSLCAFAADHSESVSTLDVSGELDLVASGSHDGTIVIRHVSDFADFSRISVMSRRSVGIVRLSGRGYVVVFSRGPVEGRENLLSVYSLSGELVASQDVGTVINAIWVDDTGYQFIAVGNCGTVRLYELLTLKFRDLLGGVEEGHAKESVARLPGEACVTAMAIIKGGCEKRLGQQSLLLGLSNGEVYVLREKFGDEGSPSKNKK